MRSLWRRMFSRKRKRGLSTEMTGELTATGTAATGRRFTGEMRWKRDWPAANESQSQELILQQCTEITSYENGVLMLRKYEWSDVLVVD